MCKTKCDLSEIDLKIIAVSNRKLCERPFLEQIERVCQMKPQAIILREKDLSEEEYRILSEEVLFCLFARSMRFRVFYISSGKQHWNWNVHLYICHCRN